MKAEKSRELFTVVETFTVSSYGEVELVKGDVHDVAIYGPHFYKYRGSCNRCCFYLNNTCRRPRQHTVSCTDNIFDNDVAFYRRKTAENIQK